MEDGVLKSLYPLLIFLLVATIACAGGVAPGEESPKGQMVREQVTATPEQTSAAVSEAREAVASPARPTPKPAPVRTASPKVTEVPMTTAKPKAAAAADQNSWLLDSRESGCMPLASVDPKAKNIGTFKTPQEFARKMQQRGYQAFVLDIGDARDQVVRVKVPDMDLDITFMKAGMCR